MQADQREIYAQIREFETGTYSNRDGDNRRQPEIQAQEKQIRSGRTIIDFSNQGIKPQAIEM